MLPVLPEGKFRDPKTELLLTLADAVVALIEYSEGSGVEKLKQLDTLNNAINELKEELIHGKAVGSRTDSHSR